MSKPPARHKHYYEALKRLQDGRPRVLPKGERITNDAVSLEAGLRKGSIKKSRAAFADLIVAIEEAASVQRDSPKPEHIGREVLDAALGRELSLLQENFELRRRLAQLTGENVLPIRRGSSES